MWTEDDLPEPQSVYAQSKLTGEWLAADCSRAYVLRVESLFGGTNRPSTIDRILTALRSGQTMRLFHDRTVTPSYVDDVAEATWQLVDRRAPCGVYHCVNTGATTWLELGRTVAALRGLDPAGLVGVSVSEVTLRAPRPQFAGLSNERLAGAGVPMPGWKDAVARYLARAPA
ncbi:MAG: sugar nucleotide-binding protein [Vicinamibacterales bacterium]